MICLLAFFQAFKFHKMFIKSCVCDLYTVYSKIETAQQLFVLKPSNPGFHYIRIWIFTFNTAALLIFFFILWIDQKLKTMNTTFIV